MNKLDQLKTALAEATPGEWSRSSKDIGEWPYGQFISVTNHGALGYAPKHDVHGVHGPYLLTNEDAQFIALAKNAMSDLLAAVDHLEAVTALGVAYDTQAGVLQFTDVNKAVKAVLAAQECLNKLKEDK